MIASLSCRALGGIHPVTKSLFGNLSCRLFQSQQDFNTVYVRFMHQTGLRQIPLLLLGLLGQNMTLVSMFPLDFPCSGKGEPLFGTGISLHFWHFALLEFVIIIGLFRRYIAKKFAKVMILFW